jgi:hypothetical protein
MSYLEYDGEEGYYDECENSNYDALCGQEDQSYPDVNEMCEDVNDEPGRNEACKRKAENDNNMNEACKRKAENDENINNNRLHVWFPFPNSLAFWILL